MTLVVLPSFCLTLVRLTGVVQHLPHFLFRDVLIDRRGGGVLVPKYLLHGLQMLALVVQEFRGQRPAPEWLVARSMPAHARYIVAMWSCSVFGL